MYYFPFSRLQLQHRLVKETQRTADGVGGRIRARPARSPFPGAYSDNDPESRI